MSQPRPGRDFAKHIVELQRAVNNVQPLETNYLGNFTALLALVNLEKAMARVCMDIAPFSIDDSIRKNGRLYAAAPRMLEFIVEYLARLDVRHTHNELAFMARALLAEIEGREG